MVQKILHRGQINTIILFLLLTLLVDRGLHILLQKGLERIETGQISGGRVNQARRTAAEVVILGSSRAMHHYNPIILEKYLHRSVYNAGSDGMGLNYCLGLMDLLLKNYTPFLFIINVDGESISIDNQRYLSRIKILAPFMDESDTVRQLIYDLDIYERIKYYMSKSYRFNGKALPIIKNMFKKDNTIKGFAPLNKTANLNLLNKKQDEIDQEKCLLSHYNMLMLRELIQHAKAAGSQVVMVNSPVWNEEFSGPPYYQRLLNYLELQANCQNIPYISINQENTPIFRNSALFADKNHLNVVGAKMFSEILAHKLTTIISQ